MSSNPQFIKILAPQEYETFTFPKEILYDKNLSPDAMKILLIMLDYGKRPNWHLRQNHLIAISGYKYHTFSKSMKNLEDAGYLKRTRIRENGKLSAYQYNFSAFPIFLNDPEFHIKTPLEEPFQPVANFKTCNSSLENRDYTYSSLVNVLEETTKPLDPEIQEKNLVGSSFQILDELEKQPNFSESQKRTLYLKFSHEQILSGLDSVDLSKAFSPFALLYKAIEREYKKNVTQSEKNKGSIEVYQKAEKYLSQFRALKFSTGIDKNFAYIYLATSISKFNLSDVDFKKKFSDSINNMMKNK